MTSVLVRGKKVAQVGSTKNKCGHPKGKKRGMKVYDGQRVPAGSILASQINVGIFPGWNVRSTKYFEGRTRFTDRAHLTLGGLHTDQQPEVDGARPSHDHDGEGGSQLREGHPQGGAVLPRTHPVEKHLPDSCSCYSR